MRTPAIPEATGTRPHHRLLLLWVSLAIAVGVVLAAFAYLALQPGAPLDLLEVSVSPSPAMPDQAVTVAAQIRGGTFLAPLQVDVHYEAFFSTGPSGAGTMFHGSGESYSATIGPFSNGSVVWVVVTAFDGHAFQISANYTLNVGTVPGSGAAGLRLNSVVLDPAHPTSIDVPSLTVNATSSAAVTEVYLATMYFSWSTNRNGAGGSAGGMQRGASGNFTTFPGMFYGVMPNSLGTTVGTIWTYRVAVQDGAGDTVLSPVYSFTVAMPAL